MTTFIKTKIKISEDQTNIDNLNFQIKEEEKLLKSVRKQGNWTFVVQTVI